MPVCRILLIEDDKVAVHAFLRMVSRLEEYQLEVVCAESLLEAMSLAKSEAFDLIVSDLGLPDSLSIETIATMSFVPLGTPIVILTGSEDPALRQVANDLRFADFLLKHTFDIDTLSHMLDKHIDGSLSGRVA